MEDAYFLPDYTIEDYTLRKPYLRQVSIMMGFLVLEGEKVEMFDRMNRGGQFWENSIKMFLSFSKGSSLNYVDQILRLFDHLPTSA